MCGWMDATIDFFSRVFRVSRVSRVVSISQHWQQNQMAELLNRIKPKPQSILST